MLVTDRRYLSSALVSAFLLSGLIGVAKASSHEEEAVQQTLPALKSVAAVAINVTDIEAAKAFYIDVLGLRVDREVATNSYLECILATPDQGAKVVLMQHLDDEHVIGGQRIVFHVRDAASVLEGFRARGLTIVREATPIRDGSPVVIGIARDADGYALEFIQRPD